MCLLCCWILVLHMAGLGKSSVGCGVECDWFCIWGAIAMVRRQDILWLNFESFLLIPCRFWTSGATKASQRHSPGPTPVSAPPTPTLPSSWHRCDRACHLSWGRRWFQDLRAETQTYVPRFHSSCVLTHLSFWSLLIWICFQTFLSCFWTSVPFLSKFLSKCSMQCI